MDSLGTSGASGLPFAVRVAVKLLLYGIFGVYLLLSTFLDSRTVAVIIQCGQSAASVFSIAVITRMYSQ